MYMLPNITPDQLLAEIDDVIRSMPPKNLYWAPSESNMEWVGRASAALDLWKIGTSIFFKSAVEKLNGARPEQFAVGLQEVVTTLHQASYHLRLVTSGPLSIPVNHGNKFRYFDELRKIIETARISLFFVDPYLDGEFVSTYMPQVPQGVSVRLLAREYVAKLAPAVKLFNQSNGSNIKVRSANEFHDRYVFVDGQGCYLSSQSFKDGAKNAPALLSQVVDAFQVVLDTYETLWVSATPVP